MEHLKKVEPNPHYPTSGRKFGYLTAETGTDLVRVEVAWREGGMNYSTYKTEPKGIYLNVQPGIKREADSIGVVESYAGFSGYCFLLKDFPKATRYSLKTLTTWASMMDKHISAIAELAKDSATAKTKIAEYITANIMTPTV